ncbi:unnamed protein product [Lupinus luteus]|uniref:F-box protein SKIP24 n=1 Tax=Lupinus luteus TaxID=3873 RepID=A0AAV1XQL4_LUPLU
MSSLPDELWRRILEIGIGTRGFTYKDLCCTSISCRRLHRLSGEDPLWNHLLSSDFSSTNTLSSKPFPTSSSAKSVYKFRFEKDKERRIAAHRRAVLRKKSEIAERSRKLTVIEIQMGQETTKLKESTAELSNLRRVRQASVALNVWQPEVVRGRQKQVVEQCVVPSESRIRALEMELRLCKQQIMGLEKSYKDEKRRLDTAKEELLSMTYHPITEHKPMNKGETEHTVKRKKLKR